MTFALQTAQYRVRLATDSADMQQCQRLRHQCFFGRDGLDQDRFDARWQHLMVQNAAGNLLACLRFHLSLTSDAILDGYAAQSYGLGALARTGAPMIEVGRVCVKPDVVDPDVLRLTWAALTALVDRHDVAMLFGCTSFDGIDPAPYGQACMRLQQHVGPIEQRPQIISPDVIALTDLVGEGGAPMPPMMRSYLGLGGWVGDHLVIDQAMNTLHLFTCLPVANVPPARARALRALAQVTDLP